MGIYMKWIRKCPVFFLLAVSGMVLAVTGAAGSGTVYKEMDQNPVMVPCLSRVMEGLGQGIMPWEVWESAAGKVFPNMGTEDEAAADVAAAGDNAVQVDPTAGMEAETEPGTEAMGQALPAASPDEGKAHTEAEEEPARTYSFVTVTEDYFNDALFIGDSRTVGLFEYGGIEERADFLAKTSLTIYEVFLEPVPVIRDEETDRMLTIEEALGRRQYGKIYLMLGINELGRGTKETFMKEYRSVVERLRELQPGAVIFVEGIMRVAGTKNERDPIFNNTNINERNEAIAGLADGKSIFYIDINEAICDQDGNLVADYTTDEVHLKAKYYELWKQFLLEHGIE